jgi:hypothetical protein
MAVLTPAVPDTFVVHAGDVFIPAESLLDSKKNDKLRKLAQSSGFSVADRLRAQVLAVLRKDGWDAVEMDMTRAAVGHAGFHCAPGATPSRMAAVDESGVE